MFRQSPVFVATELSVGEDWMIHGKDSEMKGQVVAPAELKGRVASCLKPVATSRNSFITGKRMCLNECCETNNCCIQQRHVCDSRVHSAYVVLSFSKLFRNQFCLSTSTRRKAFRAQTQLANNCVINFCGRGAFVGMAASR